MFKRLKISLAAVAGFLLLVVILQNTESVTTRILSASIEMPRAVLLLVLLASGFVLGYATCFWQKLRRRSAEEAKGLAPAQVPGDDPAPAPAPDPDPATDPTEQQASAR